MSLQNRFDSVSTSAHRKPTECSICWLIKQLGEEDRAALIKALKSTMMTSVLTQILNEEGHDVSSWAVGRHRKRNHNVTL